MKASAVERLDVLRKRMVGPVYPIPPAFRKDGSIDFDAVRDYVKFLTGYKVRTVMVTAGTSRFNLLTDEEVKELNRTVVQAADSGESRPLVIAANPPVGSTDRAIDFAKHAQEIGADCILLYYPERYYSDDAIFEYFKNVAESVDIGVMIHAVPLRNAKIGSATKKYSIDLCTRLAGIKNIVGMKEELGDEGLRYKLAANLSDRMTFVVAGGSMWKFLTCAGFGVQAYLVGVGSFAPKIEEDFYRYFAEGDYRNSLKIVKVYEEPFFDVALPIGWHIAMKGAMDLLGLMSADERAPLRPADDTQRVQLRDVLSNIGLSK